ncbi:unnamed protein product [Calypogeia fissa]
MGSSSENSVLDGIEQGGMEYLSDDKWVPSSSAHTPPKVTVSEPSGSFCQLDSRFSVPLPPDDVYEIIIDPNNRRVFKNVKEVTYRKVLEDDGNRQLVEVEQLGRWRFLIFNGVFTCRVKVEQNRQEHSMRYNLAQQGMMEKFMGSWKIDPQYEEDADSTSSNASSSGESSFTSETVEKARKCRLTGSWVTLHQMVQPAFVPPWPLKGYVRGVCGQIVQDVCVDLQLEAIRLAELKSTPALKSQNSDMYEVD